MPGDRLSQRRTPRKAFAAALIGLLAVAGGVCHRGDERPLNLLFVSIDTCRADHLSYYGYPRLTSPNIDRFAARSVVFRNAFTTVPKTGPAMVSFFTGKYAQNHGVTRNVLAIPDEQRMLAELLQEEFRTGAVVSNGTMSPARRYDAGFDDFRLVGFTWQVSEYGLRWLKRHGESRFFLWLHYLDPHGPYQPPRRQNEIFLGDELYDPSRRVPLDYSPTPGLNPNHVLGAVPAYQRLGSIDVVDYYVAQYDAEIRYVDEQLARVLHYLEASGLDERTMVVLTSDHGESLGEHDYYFEHGMLVNEGSIHVPLIISHPHLDQPQHVDALVQSIDVLPTLLSQLDLDHPEGMDGVDLSGLLRSGDGGGREFVYACSTFPNDYLTFFETIRTQRGKFVRSGDGRVRYYDLRADPGETADRLSSLDPLLRERWVGEFGAFGRSTVESDRMPELPDDLRRQLEKLGYVDP